VRARMPARHPRSCRRGPYRRVCPAGGRFLGDDTSMTSTAQPLKRDALRVDLALQGGGAHGAYTWCVIDRLLGEPWLRIEGISGTSAGAMNAAVLIPSTSLSTSRPASSRHTT